MPSPSESESSPTNLEHQRQLSEDITVAMGGVAERLPPVNKDDNRFPYCIVWTPIPVLTWILPMIGHMGICTSIGVIRDFAGAYFVSEDQMAFGNPTRYLRLHPKYAQGGTNAWDEAVSKASVLYGTRIHNIFCDNCHSHVATALNNMRYKNSSSWNMIILSMWLFVCGRYTSIWGILKTWLPFAIFVTIIVLLAVYF
ncbi:transmembrane protein 222 isoform X1 [Drosophila guanche]|uniref:Blast:Transmembrane protein 222 n=2 Tax=Drosophila guanche TaxID=7266 RepID=A0A3B0JWA8_DROGU|nr:transmembrane protein 222 isoform X1 [Drosophila guanche]SPP79780.1 blast:Transmembrane protein 222 [Drosophila guanche]